MQEGLTLTNLTTGSLVHSGIIKIASSKNLEINGGLQIEANGVLELEEDASVHASSLLGNGTNNHVFSDLGVIYLHNGTLEVMSNDLGNTGTGFENNFSFGSLFLSGSIQLVDNSDNSSLASSEALYADSLTIESSAVIDLGGKNVYVRHLQNNGGTIINGVILEFQGF